MAADTTVQQTVHALYSDHHGWLVAWLRKRLNNPQQAADLAQDTFVRILSTREQLGLVREPRAWLASIARGLMIDAFRRADLERAWLAELACLPEEIHPSPEERLMVLETLEAINHMLDGLPPKVRAAWLYNRLDGMKHAEIAGKLGVSVSRVRQYLATAARHCYVIRYGEPLAASEDESP